MEILKIAKTPFFKKEKTLEQVVDHYYAIQKRKPKCESRLLFSERLPLAWKYCIAGILKSEEYSLSVIVTGLHKIHYYLTREIPPK